MGVFICFAPWALLIQKLMHVSFFPPLADVSKILRLQNTNTMHVLCGVSESARAKWAERSILEQRCRTERPTYRFLFRVYYFDRNFYNYLDFVTSFSRSNTWKLVLTIGGTSKSSGRVRRVLKEEPLPR